MVLVKIAAAAVVLCFGVWLMFFQNISVSLSDTELHVTGGVGQQPHRALYGHYAGGMAANAG